MAVLFHHNDLIVGEWDPISTLYGSLWANPEQFISFPAEAVSKGLKVLTELQDAIFRAQVRKRLEDGFTS